MTTTTMHTALRNAGYDDANWSQGQRWWRLDAADCPDHLDTAAARLRMAGLVVSRDGDVLYAALPA